MIINISFVRISNAPTLNFYKLHLRGLNALMLADSKLFINNGYH